MIPIFLKEYGVWAMAMAMVLLGGVITVAVKGDIVTWFAVWENVKDVGKIIALASVLCFQLIYIFIVHNKRTHTKKKKPPY